MSHTEDLQSTHPSVYVNIGFNRTVLDLRSATTSTRARPAPDKERRRPSTCFNRTSCSIAFDSVDGVDVNFLWSRFDAEQISRVATTFLECFPMISKRSCPARKAPWSPVQDLGSVAPPWRSKCGTFAILKKLQDFLVRKQLDLCLVAVHEEYTFCQM